MNMTPKHKTTTNATKKILVAALSVLMLAGCGTTLKGEPKTPVKLIDISNPEVALSPVFAAKIGGESGFKLIQKNTVSPKEIANLQIAKHNNKIIAVSQNGIIQAFDNGVLSWQSNLNTPISSGVGYDVISEIAIVTTKLGQVVAINGKTGEHYWTQNLGTTVLNSALIAGNRVLLSGNNGVIYGLNLQTGATVWQYNTQNPSISVRGVAKPLRLDGNTALFGMADGRIHAVNSDNGRALWSRRIGTGRLADVDATPLVVGNRLYVSSFAGNLTAFDMSAGQTLFVTPDFKSSNSVAYVNGVLIGNDNEGMVYGFDATTGKRIWQNNALKHRKPSNPVSIGQFVAMGDYEGAVHLFNQKGNLVGRTKAGGQIVSLQADGNQLYAQTATGHVVVWQVQ